MGGAKTCADQSWGQLEFEEKDEWIRPLLVSDKEEACPNISFMLVTADVFQSPTSWLNEVASRNILCMLVTAEVFQSPMS